MPAIRKTVTRAYAGEEFIQFKVADRRKGRFNDRAVPPYGPKALHRGFIRVKTLFTSVAENLKLPIAIDLNTQRPANIYLTNMRIAPSGADLIAGGRCR
jgi:hypothetical protein